MTRGQEPKASDAWKLLPPGQLVASKRLGVPKVRECVRVSRISPNIVICPFNENLETLRRAVAERVFLVKENGSFVAPPKPKLGHFGKTLSVVGQRLVDTYRRSASSTAPLSFDATVATFTGRKRARYERAYQHICERHVNVAKEAEVSVFVKYEKTDRTTKSDPVPRVISPRSPEYNLRVARFLRKLEEPLFDAIGDLFGHKTVMKGVTATQTARLISEKWQMFNRPVAVGLDASRFDQHVSREALQFEHSIYTRCFPVKRHREELSRLLKYQLRNRCSGYVPDGSVKYTTDGTRMSGDMNTSLGNCVLMCLMVKAYSEELGINLQLANNGDDCVVFMEQHDLARFSKNLDGWFRKMGFNMVVEAPSMAMEEIEFCQCRPVYDGVSWVMCRNPWTALAKDSVLLKNPKQVSAGFFATWLDAVGQGGLSLAGGLPVFQTFYQMYIRSGQEFRRNRYGRHVKLETNELLPWFMRETGLKGGRKAAPVSPEARSSFYFAFGVTPDEQLALEEYYDSMLVSRSYGEWHPREIFPVCV